MFFNHKKLKVTGLILLILFGFNLSIYAQSKGSLSIGDKAPPLKYGKWIKGDPIKEYKKGHLYLFEFWATWCGPCIASMPHLSEFARQHKDDATVIAVNVWEKTGDKPYETSGPKVERFVEQMKDKMDFNVITDTKDQFMGSQWLKAAGQTGIPCTIMVKDSTVMWIGHPIELDSIVDLVMKGKFDIELMKTEKAEKSRQQEEAMRPFNEVYARFQKLTAEKKFKEAIAVIDSASNAMPAYAGTLGFFKFMTLMEINEDEAMVFAKEWQATNPGYVGSAAGVILSKKGLKNSTYKYGIELMETMLQKPEVPQSDIYMHIAKGYAYMNDFKKATEIQLKAISIAKQYLKEGKFSGFVLDEGVKDMEKTLANYQVGKI